MEVIIGRSSGPSEDSIKTFASAHFTITLELCGMSLVVFDLHFGILPS
jgi:hypothetical protein